MADNIIKLSPDEEKIVSLPNRGASGLRILFSVSDPSVVSVQRKEIQPSETGAMNIRPGDPIPALFSIRAIGRGNATISFVERKPGSNDGDDLPLKDFEVTVND